MAGKTIKVTIDENGDAKAEAFNFHGKGCGVLIKALTDALGGTITADQTKREYWETDQCITNTITR